MMMLLLTSLEKKLVDFSMPNLPSKFLDTLKIRPFCFNFPGNSNIHNIDAICTWLRFWNTSFSKYFSFFSWIMPCFCTVLDAKCTVSTCFSAPLANGAARVPDCRFTWNRTAELLRAVARQRQRRRLDSTQSQPEWGSYRSWSQTLRPESRALTRRSSTW